MKIRGGRHPHEVLLLIAAVLLGVVGTFWFSQVGTTTLRALPYPFGHVLYAGLGAGALVSLIGIFKRSLWGMVVERAGLFGLGIFCLLYATFVIINSGWRGLGFTVFMGAFAVANFLRVRQVGKEIIEQQAVRVIISNGEKNEVGE